MRSFRHILYGTVRARLKRLHMHYVQRAVYAVLGIPCAWIGLETQSGSGKLTRRSKTNQDICPNPQPLSRRLSKSVRSLDPLTNCLARANKSHVDLRVCPWDGRQQNRWRGPRWLMPSSLSVMLPMLVECPAAPIRFLVSEHAIEAKDRFEG